MSESAISAHVRETGESSFAVRIALSGHVLLGDEPEEAGGRGLGPAPYELLLAALGECTAMTVRWYARRMNWPLERVEVDLTHRTAPAEDGSETTDLFTKAVALHGKALSDDQRQRLIDVASKCPVQRTLERASTIVTTRKDATAMA